MVTDLTASPVTTCEAGKCFSAALLWLVAGDVVGYLGNFFGFSGLGTMDDHQAACAREISLHGLKSKYLYFTFVETSVVVVGVFGVGKKGG